MAKRPRDPIKLAKEVFDIAIGEAEDTVSESKRHPSPKRKGGLKGAKARAYVHAPLHSPDKRLFQEDRESYPHGCDSRRALQFRENPQDSADYARDGGWYHRSCLVA